MRLIMLWIIFAVMIFFVVSCGPGQPFEIEGRNTTQSETPTQIAAVR